MWPACDDPLTERQEEFVALMARVEAGSTEAAETLVNLYQSHLEKGARLALGKWLRAKLDPVDVAQMVWWTFFASVRKAQAFNCSQAFVSFLTRVAACRVVSVMRHYHRARRDVELEVALEELTNVEQERLVAHSPGPLEVALGNEQLKRLIAGLPRNHVEIILRKAIGESDAEIAAAVGVHERTVRKVVSSIASSVTAKLTVD